MICRISSADAIAVEDGGWGFVAERLERLVDYADGRHDRPIAASAFEDSGRQWQ